MISINIEKILSSLAQKVYTFVGNSFLASVTVQDLVANPNITGTDFSSSNVVSWSCNKEVITRQDGTVRIKYIDNADAVIIASITA